MDYTKTLVGELQYEGVRMTPLRRSLIEIFSTRKSPLSFEDLTDYLKKRKQSHHKASLYRELAFLEEWKVVDRVDLQDGVKRYELRGRDHHHHLICVKCSDVQDVPLKEQELDAEKMAIEKKLQFKVLKHSLEFFGLCVNCQ